MASGVRPGAPTKHASGTVALAKRAPSGLGTCVMSAQFGTVSR